MCEIICVTNRHLVEGDFIRQLERIAGSGVRAIVLREKDLGEQEYEVLLKRAVEVCNGTAAAVYAHNFVGAAIRSGVRRIHLPLHVLRELDETTKGYFELIGASCHSAAEAYEAQQLGAGYVFAGHIFETDCKKGLPARGTKLLREVCDSVDIPVYAIGGIAPDKMRQVLQCGARGGCVMSGLMKADQPRELVQKLMKGAD